MGKCSQKTLLVRVTRRRGLIYLREKLLLRNIVRTVLQYEFKKKIFLKLVSNGRPVRMQHVSTDYITLFMSSRMIYKVHEGIKRVVGNINPTSTYYLRPTLTFTRTESRLHESSSRISGIKPYRRSLSTLFQSDPGDHRGTGRWSRHVYRVTHFTDSGVSFI